MGNKKQYRVTRGYVLVKFGNGHALQSEVELGDGLGKIFVHGDERPEVWANCIGVVVGSGVPGLKVGDIVGCSYQATFDYEHDEWGNKIWGRNCFFDDFGDMIFKVKEELVMWTRHSAKLGDPVDTAYGNWVLLREARWPSDGLAVGLKRGIAIHVSGLEEDGVECGDEVLFNETFRGSELYDRKYLIMDRSRILAKPSQPSPTASHMAKARKTRGVSA